MNVSPVKLLVLGFSIECLEKTLFPNDGVMPNVTNQCIPNARQTTVSTYSIRDQLCCCNDILPSEYMASLNKL